ncbi:MAG: hypothetical protein NTX91_01360 [candidate division SR1 bacterium]|nr:hypothetical protein [candidate division SR1 bacterium]
MKRGSSLPTPFIHIQKFNGKPIIPWIYAPEAIQELFAVLQDTAIPAILAEDMAVPLNDRIAHREFILCTPAERATRGTKIEKHVVDPRAELKPKKQYILGGKLKEFEVQLTKAGIIFDQKNLLYKELKKLDFLVRIHPNSRKNIG